MTSNEGKACDAVIQLLESRLGNIRSNVRHPERDGSGPSVELLLNIGHELYAIEHTLVEAFSEQISTDVAFSQLIDAVEAELRGTLPTPGVFELILPTDVRLGVSRNRLPEVQESIVNWVRDRAQRLHDEHPDRPTKSQNPRGYREQCRETLPEYSLELTLVRTVAWYHAPRHRGILLISRYAPDDVEILREKRLDLALQNKCPKLKACKDTGAVSILVLENNDLPLSNHILICDALSKSIMKRTDHPDEIYLVETICEPWTVWQLGQGEYFLPKDSWQDFDPSQLDDITNS